MLWKTFSHFFHAMEESFPHCGKLKWPAVHLACAKWYQRISFEFWWAFTDSRPLSAGRGCRGFLLDLGGAVSRKELVDFSMGTLRGRPELDSCPRVVGFGASTRRRCRLVSAPPKSKRNPLSPPPSLTPSAPPPPPRMTRERTTPCPAPSRLYLRNSSPART